MTTTAFYLIITFWVQGFGQSWSPAFTSQIIPGYPSEATCQQAGERAKVSFNGGGNVNWACVPAPEAKP